MRLEEGNGDDQRGFDHRKKCLLVPCTATLSGLNNRNLFYYRSGGKNSMIKMLSELISGDIN